MLKGYSRVSTNEQNLDMQIDALIAAGCAKEDIITDKISGATVERPGLDILLNHSLRPGDNLVVWRLDRLGRTTKMLIELIEQLHKRGIQFKSLTEQIDTSSSNGTLIFHIFCALAEHERNVLKEHTLSGLAAARGRGRKGARRQKGQFGQAALRREKDDCRRDLSGSWRQSANALSICSVTTMGLYHHAVCGPSGNV